MNVFDSETNNDVGAIDNQNRLIQKNYLRKLLLFQMTKAKQRSSLYKALVFSRLFKFKCYFQYLKENGLYEIHKSIQWRRKRQCSLGFGSLLRVTDNKKSIKLQLNWAIHKQVRCRKKSCLRKFSRYYSSRNYQQFSFLSAAYHYQVKSSIKFFKKIKLYIQHKKHCSLKQERRNLMVDHMTNKKINKWSSNSLKHWYKWSVRISKITRLTKCDYISQMPSSRLLLFNHFQNWRHVHQFKIKSKYCIFKGIQFYRFYSLTRYFYQFIQLSRFHHSIRDAELKVVCSQRKRKGSVTYNNILIKSSNNNVTIMKFIWLNRMCINLKTSHLKRNKDNSRTLAADTHRLIYQYRKAINNLSRHNKQKKRLVNEKSKYFLMKEKSLLKMKYMYFNTWKNFDEFSKLMKKRSIKMNEFIKKYHRYKVCSAAFQVLRRFSYDIPIERKKYSDRITVSSLHFMKRYWKEYRAFYAIKCKTRYVRIHVEFVSFNKVAQRSFASLQHATKLRRSQSKSILKAIHFWKIYRVHNALATMHHYVRNVAHAREVKRMANLYFSKNTLKFSIVKCINYAPNCDIDDDGIINNNNDDGKNGNIKIDNKVSCIGNLKLAFKRWYQLLRSRSIRYGRFSCNDGKPSILNEEPDCNATRISSSSSTLDTQILHFANQQLRKPKQLNINHLDYSLNASGEEDLERKAYYNKNLRISFANEIINTIMQLRRSIKEI